MLLNIVVVGGEEWVWVKGHLRVTWVRGNGDVRGQVK